MSKAEAFEVNFGENKSIGVNVNFSKGDAIQVPVSINSLDAEKVGKEVGDRIAEKLDETALANVAKEQTLLMESQRIQDEVRNIDLSSIENKVEEVKQAVNNIDLSPIETKVDEGVATLSTKIDNIDLSSVAKQGENPEATNSKILEEIGKIPNIARLYTAYAVKNDDGENTYSIVLPVSSDAIDNGDETVTLKLQ